MEKLMIASDLHGSARYCQLLLQRFQQEGGERLLLLGDLLYHGPRNDLPEGYAPKQVIELLNGCREHLLCVRGNCDGEVDQMVLDFPILAEYAGEHGLVLTMESLRPEESNLVTTVSDAKRMIDEVASPYLQPMVDTTAMGVAGETLEDWFATFGDGAIHEMHFIDGDPYGHLVWGDGKHDMDAFVATLNAHGFDGMLGQEITDGRYYDDPAAADAKNMAAFEKYLID